MIWDKQTKKNVKNDCHITLTYTELCGARDVMIIVANCVQILDEAVCILHSANTLGKGMNLTILHPVNNRTDWAL